MIKKVLISSFLLLSLAYYDEAVRHTGGDYSVNLGAFYFTSWHAFAFFVFLIFYSETRILVYKSVFLIFDIAIFVNLYQNLISFNKAYDVFQLNVNNPVIDYIKWSILIISLVFVLAWESLKLKRKYS